jgi:signal transduction histidine kinase
MEVRPVAFDMRQLLAKTMHALAPLAAQKHLPLLTDVAPEVDQVTSDPHRVEQILLNLGYNAIKFTEHGEIRLSCRVSDGRVLTSVTDTGIGIHPEDLHKLFTAFWQLDSTLARKHEGTGLGLAICKRLAHLLGGEILVESQWEVGSTFTLVLPHNA